MEQEPFSKVMRKATRGIHSISDTLINAKLGVAMTDDRVWADGLLIFYEIFKHLEAAMERLKGTVVEELDLPGMHRTEAFEKDLEFYLGESWKTNYIPHQTVLHYLDHLSAVEKDQPVLLLAYIYHLYMGLFAGGQILRRKRALARKFSLSKASEGGHFEMEGLSVMNLDGKVYQLKKQMTEVMNRVAETLDEETKRRLMEESKNVFRLNNEVVSHIPGTSKVVFHKLLKVSFVVLIIALLIYYFKASGG